MEEDGVCVRVYSMYVCKKKKKKKIYIYIIYVVACLHVETPLQQCRL